jgi:hypothetical protein
LRFRNNASASDSRFPSRLRRDERRLLLSLLLKTGMEKRRTL